MKLPNVQHIFPELQAEFRIHGKPYPFIRVDYRAQRQRNEVRTGPWPFHKKKSQWHYFLEVETWTLLNYDPKHREIVPQEELLAELVCQCPFDLQITTEAADGQQASRLIRGLDFVGELGGIQPFRQAALEVGWLWQAEDITPWETWPSKERQIERELMGRGAHQVAQEQAQAEEQAEAGPDPRDLLHTRN